jgi:hypothetical protein
MIKHITITIIVVWTLCSAKQTGTFYRYEEVSETAQGGEMVEVNNYSSKDVKIKGSENLREASVFGPLNSKNEFDKCSLTCLRKKLIRIQLQEIAIENPKYIWYVQVMKSLNYDSLDDLRLNHADRFANVRIISSVKKNYYYVIDPKNKWIRFLGSHDLENENELNLDEISLLPIGQDFYFFTLSKDKDEYLFDLKKITTGKNNLIGFTPKQTPNAEIVKRIMQ